jgi:hypothetical protein
MKCPNCNGTLKFVEEVMGSFVCSIDDNGVVDYDDKDFYGESWPSVECDSCKATFGFDYSKDGETIFLLGEEY